MLRQTLPPLAAAAASFAIAAATGLGATSTKVVTMHVGDIVSFPSDNFHCQALTTTQIACGAKLAPHSVQVYYAPHQLEVLEFGTTTTKAEVLLNVKR